jgi:hypothetical protein
VVGQLAVSTIIVRIMLQNEILLQVPPHARFICYALKANVSIEIFQPHIFTNGIYAFFESPFQVDELWRESLGTVHK